jgi:signal transduction histidine kinase
MISNVQLVYIFLSFLSSVISFYLFINGLKRRKVLGAGSFAAMTLAIGVWSFFKGFEVSANSEYWKLFFLKLEYIGILMIPPSLFFFSLQYSDLVKKVKIKWVVPFAVLFLISLVLVGSNGMHGLYWTSNNLQTTRGVGHLDSEYGPFHLMITLYSYSLLLFSTLILIFAASRRSNFYRIQSGLVIIAILFPWIFNIITVLNIDPHPEYDITILSFIITGSLLFFALFKYNLLDLSPIARDKLMDHITDGVIVVDDKDRVIEINGPGIELLKIDVRSPFGIRFRKLGGPHSRLMDRLSSAAIGIHEDEISNGNEHIHLEIRILPLEKSRNGLMGKMFIIKDISHLKKTELALKNARDQLETKVRERTLELKKVNVSLKYEIRERMLAEEKTREEWARAELYLDLLGHDIGNLNQVLLARTELLKLKIKDDDGLMEEVGIIEDTLRRAVNLVSDIRLVSSMETKPPRNYPINIIYVVNKVIRDISERYKDCEITLDHRKDISDVNVLAEPMIEKAFFNIIDNGIKVQRGRRPRIDITVGIPPSIGDQVRIEIADHGPGIPDKAKSDLLDRKMKMGVKMLTGIGLITARSIVERYDGRISIRNRDPKDHSKGAKFIIDLPGGRKAIP